MLDVAVDAPSSTAPADPGACACACAASDIGGAGAAIDMRAYEPADEAQPAHTDDAAHNHTINIAFQRIEQLSFVAKHQSNRRENAPPSRVLTSAVT